MTISFRMIATTGTLRAFPTLIRRSYRSIRSGFWCDTTSTAMYSSFLGRSRPSWMLRAPVFRPLSPATGATPARAAAWRFPIHQGPGIRQKSAAATTSPTPFTGIEGEQGKPGTGGDGKPVRACGDDLGSEGEGHTEAAAQSEPRAPHHRDPDHRGRDVSFGEDACTGRTGHSPADNAIRNDIALALNLQRNRDVTETKRRFALHQGDPFARPRRVPSRSGDIGAAGSNLKGVERRAGSPPSRPPPPPVPSGIPLRNRRKPQCDPITRAVAGKWENPRRRRPPIERAEIRMYGRRRHAHRAKL